MVYSTCIVVWYGLYKGHVDKKQTFEQQCIAVTHAVMAQQSLNDFIPKKCKTSFDLSTNMASEVISEHLILKISDSVVVYSFTKHDQNM